LKFKGWMRRLGRSLRSVKGVLLTLVGLVVFAPYLLSWLFARHIPGEARGMNIEATRRLGPWMLLLYCVLTLLFSSGERAIYFTPSEVDFLFPAPFRRRQLLAYKIANNLGLAALSAAFMSLFLGQNAAMPLAAYVGMFLALSFMNLFAMAVALTTATVGAVAF